jgi:two-component system, OmpR family, alkaline phosphatase synthesis response regulator PhoP
VPSILVIDDEANIRELVGLYLTAAGFEVTGAEDGAQGLEVFRSLNPALVVLDYMLPGMDGLAVCRAIRAESNTPVIMLTARDSDLDKVSLLESGADDYVVKPFSPPEFVARVRAVLRRVGSAEAPAADAIVLGGLRMVRSERTVELDGAPLTLTAREFDLLEVLADDPGVVFSRERLLERVAEGADYVDLRGIDVHIRHLREKLGDDANAPRFIETVRGVGYRVRKDTA